MESPEQNNYVKLEPFIHQVGGHSSMLCLDERTVCKPLVERELQFYETLPEPLKRFVPTFYGVLQVKILPEDDCYVALIASPPERYSPRTTNNKQKIRIRRTGSIEIEGGIQDLFEQEEDSCEFVQEANKHGAAINPWVFKCHQNQLRKMINSIKEGDTKPNFILLENLTWKFNFPCILDLKMGTRQYGDNASLPKKQSKMFKVVSTTSGKLGVRIGGMQVYQITTHQFLCRNKFFGRSLSVGGFQQALRQFLHNGSRLRSDVLAPLIRRLEELVGILTQQESVRFYTTSLLLIYDGLDLSCGQSNTKFDFEVKNLPHLPRKIEEQKFTNACCRRSSSVEKLDCPLKELSVDDTSCCTHRRSSSTGLYDELTPSSPLPSPRPPSNTPEPFVDVRIIDFAHSTHKGLNDPVVYSGPDQGFLFGLENMITLLKSIERDHG